MKTKKAKPPAQCEVDGCGAIIRNPCRISMTVVMCQQDARRLMIDEALLKISLVSVQPAPASAPSAAPGPSPHGAGAGESTRAEGGA